MSEFVFPEDSNLHWVDYLVFGVFLLINIVVGTTVAIINKKNAAKSTGTEQFILGGADIHPFPVALSLISSFMSAIFVVSIPIESYNFGISYGYLGLSYLVVFPMVAYLVLPVFYNLKISSIYEVKVYGALTYTYKHDKVDRFKQVTVLQTSNAGSFHRSD